MAISAFPPRRAAVPAAVLFLALGLSLAANGQALRASVVSAGGASMSNTSFQLRATLGQPVAGRTAGASQTHRAGFWYLLADAGTGVPNEDGATPEASGLPDRYRLDGNYPNPFNPQTTIRYALPEPAHVRLAVYDVVGRQVRLLVDRREAAGRHTAAFAAADLPSGTYFYRLEAGDFREVRSMLLVK